MGSIFVDNQFIFARNDGHPQLRKVVETRLKCLLKKAGIEKILLLIHLLTHHS